MPYKHSEQSFGHESKQTRKMQMIKQKIELLDMTKEGRSYVEVGHHYRLNVYVN